MIPINSSVVSGVAISEIEDQTKILMLKRANDGFWCHVAGKIEEGETGWQAIVREFYEETKIEASLLYDGAYLEQFYLAQKDLIELIPAFVLFCEPNQPVELNEEHTAYRWCSFEEAIGLVPFPNQKALYEHVKRYFVDVPPSELMRIRLEE